jgi:SAM-dependent methyltransferase
MELDQHYRDPRLAAIYDVENTARNDIDFYLEVAAERAVRDVADLGCGTGVLACDMAERGYETTGVDPARAMLDVARDRPRAERVHWVEGTAEDLVSGAYDLVIMTGHVAQVFLDDQQWLTVLRHIHRSLRPGGCLAFESRDPRAEAWRTWNREDSYATFPAGDGHDGFASWVETTDVQPGQLTFEGWTVWSSTGEAQVSTSTLRFRSREELEADLAATGYVIAASYGDWDRTPITSTSRELIFLATRA